MSIFKKATKKQSKIKIAIQGPAGSGKTTAALILGTTFGKVAYLDTERSASLYADQFDFDVLEIDAPHEPEKYVEAIAAAEAAGYDCIVLDSYSHEWVWCLEMSTKLSAGGGNSYTTWGKITPRHDSLIRKILASKIHVIACMRSKAEYVLEENAKGKSVPKKVGMASIQRDGVDYEFGVVFELSQNHMAFCSKDRTRLFAGKDMMITGEVGEQIIKWFSSGEAVKTVDEEIAEATTLDELTNIYNDNVALQGDEDFIAKLGKRKAELGIE